MALVSRTLVHFTLNFRSLSKKILEYFTYLAFLYLILAESHKSTVKPVTEISREYLLWFSMSIKILFWPPRLFEFKYNWTIWPVTPKVISGQLFSYWILTSVTMNDCGSCFLRGLTGIILIFQSIIRNLDNNNKNYYTFWSQCDYQNLKSDGI